MNNMSSRLVTGDEATVWAPMPWAAISQSGQRQPVLASTSGGRPDTSGRRDSQEDLHSKITRLEQDINQARAAARAEGEAFAKQQVQAELQPALQKLAASIHESAELRGRLREQAEADLVRLAIAIARKIVGREINTDPEVIAGVVKASLERMRQQEVLRVRIHPDFKAKVSENLARLGASHVEVLGDPTCERGAVLFETSRGNLDASVETQLREIERGLIDKLER